VVVAVVPVRVVEMARHEVIGVIGVGHGLVAASRTVHVGRLVGAAVAAGGAAVGVRPRTEAVLLDVVSMGVVEVAVVELVGVPVVDDRRVPAGGAVAVRVVGMGLMLVVCHGESLAQRDRWTKPLGVRRVRTLSRSAADMAGSRLYSLDS
jgi:hypothetical protein